MPGFDAIELKVRVLDCIARNPHCGFNDLLKVAKKPRATLAKTLNQLVAEKLLEKKPPEKMGRKHKTVYRLTPEGIKYLQQRKVVLSFIQGLKELTTIPYSGEAAEITFVMGEVGLTSILIRLSSKMAEKLFEKLGGQLTVSHFKHTGLVPEEYIGIFTRLTHGINAVLAKSLADVGPMVIANGEVTELPEQLDEPMAKLLRSPIGIDLLSSVLWLYEKMEKEEVANLLATLIRKLDPKTVNELVELFRHSNLKTQ